MIWIDLSIKSFKKPYNFPSKLRPAYWSTVMPVPSIAILDVQRAMGLPAAKISAGGVLGFGEREHIFTLRPFCPHFSSFDNKRSSQ